MLLLVLNPKIMYIPTKFSDEVWFANVEKIINLVPTAPNFLQSLNDKILPKKIRSTMSFQNVDS
jgi:hypothetical protein